MSSAAATSLISTPDRLLSFTAVALNRSPYLATLRGPALATTHLQAVSPRCQLIRGKLGVRVGSTVRRLLHCASVSTGTRHQRSMLSLAKGFFAYNGADVQSTGPWHEPELSC